ncbi:MAG TPA: LysR family transcriptional regulator [Symbiobacteriaceae bacterium]|nr:LysR family transcriptional regulator [Symbiobacteriaceae bacterium]
MLPLSYRVFCDIIETGSFSKAALRNGLSQPAVSQQVKALETGLGQQLIDRTRGQLQLTEAGEIFYEGARAILDLHHQMAERLRDLNEEIAGTVRVATIYSIGLHELPPYLKRFIRRYPKAHLHIEYNRTNRVYEAVRQGGVDIGIVAYPRETKQIEVIPLPADELVVILPPSHPLARRPEPLRLADLNGHDFIGFEADIPTRIATDRFLGRAGVHPRIVQEFDNVETIKRSVEAELGIAIVPSRTAQAEAAAGSLVIRTVADVKLERPVGVLTRRGRAMSQTLAQFLTILQGPSEG